MRSGPAKGLKRKGGFMFLPSPIRAEDIFLKNLKLQGKIVYDIGGHIGVMSLFFSRAVGSSGKVITFEPNPDYVIVANKNIEINNLQNIQIHNIAIGDKRESNTLVVPKEHPGSASMNRMIVQKFEQSSEKLWYYQVEVFPLDNYVEEKYLPIPDFIKIDTEGFEYQCLLGMQRIIHDHHPELYIEMHGATLQEKMSNAHKIVGFLCIRGYAIYSVELREMITRDNYQLGVRGHLYCKYGSGEAEYPPQCCGT